LRRFDRLSQAGVFENFFAMLPRLSKTAHSIGMFDSTVISAQVFAAGAKGGRTERASVA